MATLDFGGGFRMDAYEIKAHVSMNSLMGILIRVEDSIDPAELSVCDAEMLERIAGKIRKFYNSPKIEVDS